MRARRQFLNAQKPPFRNGGAPDTRHITRWTRYTRGPDHSSGELCRGDFHQSTRCAALRTQPRTRYVRRDFALKMWSSRPNGPHRKPPLRGGMLRMSWRYAPWSTRLVRFQKPGARPAIIPGRKIKFAHSAAVCAARRPKSGTSPRNRACPSKGLPSAYRLAISTSTSSGSRRELGCTT